MQNLLKKPSGVSFSKNTFQLLLHLHVAIVLKLAFKVYVIMNLGVIGDLASLFINTY